MARKRARTLATRKRAAGHAGTAARRTSVIKKRQAAFWDYDIPEGWKPKTEDGWIWYLERKLNHGDFKGLDPRIVKRYLPKLRLDEGRRLLLDAYFRRYAGHSASRIRRPRTVSPHAQ